MHAGVYLDHTGPPTWEQLAWGAILLCQSTRDGVPEPTSAALGNASALRAYEGAGRTTSPVEVVVADERRVARRDGLVVVRSSGDLGTVRWHRSPPRVAYELAVVEVAARHQRVVDVAAELARALGSRRTTAERLRATLDTRPTLPGRRMVSRLLADLATGACSALEHGYLTKVERAHALPAPARQVKGRSRTAVMYRDAKYDDLVIELDGRAWHDSVEDRDRDADRDLLASVAGRATVRLTWGQVFDRPCWTATQVARLLRVTPRRCGAACALAST